MAGGGNWDGSPMEGSSQGGGSGGGMSPEQAAMLAKLGIDPSVFAQSADDDPMVRTSRQVEDSDAWGSRMLEIPEEKRSSDLYKEFYKMSGAELEALQRRLFAAGFYPSGADEDDIVWGVHDPLSFKAWQSAVDRAAAFNESGRTETLDAIIAMGKRAAKDSGGGRGPLVTQVSNPDDLRRAAKQAFSETLGKADPALIEKFVSSYQASQASAQKSAYDMEGGAGGQIVSPASPGTAAEALARKADPVQAEAYGTYQRAREFFDLLGGD